MSLASSLLQLLEGDMLFYHGTTKKFDRFDPKFAGHGVDQEGPGFYFTSSEQEARGYAYPDGHVLVARLNMSRVIPATKGITKETKAHARTLLQAAPDLSDQLANWGEDPKQAFQYALSLILNRDDARDIFLQVWYDFYRYNPDQWLTNMVNLGYDGVLLDRVDNVYHAIVYNSDCIELIETRFL